jgi:hypothetical protein
MRYLLAIAVALLLISAVLSYAAWLKDAMNSELRAMLVALKSQGNLPAELDPESATMADLRGFDTELPERLKNKMFTSDLIFGLWFAWIPAVLLLCFGTACLLPRGAPTRR